MPAINPNNYNIDFFQSYTFGEITDSNYLSYLFGQNLQALPDELINGPAGNFTSKYNEKGLEKDINYTTITNPGSIDEWLLDGNYAVNLFEISYQNPSQNVGANQYGPSSLQAFNYENPELIVDNTGFIQYPTSVGGDVVLTTLLSEGLDAVGISSTNFINFDSPLNTIAQERRLEEAKNRIRDGIIENTVGLINLDPLGLLAGESLFNKDYKITKQAGGILGSAINIASDIAGLNTLSLTELFGGPIPDGAFDWDAPLDDPFSINTIDITEKLLNRTGKGTRNLLFDALSANKYGPVIEGQNDTLSQPPKASDSNQPTQKSGYLAYGEIQKAKSKKQDTYKDVLKNVTFNDSPFTDKLGTRPPISFNTANKSAKDITSNLPTLDEVTVTSTNKQRNSRPDVPVEPTEAENPSLALKTVDALKFQGFEFEPNGAEYDPTYDSFKGGWDFGHNSDWDNQYTAPRQIVPFGPYESPGSYTGNDGPEPGPRVWNRELYWRDGRTEELPKRGLLAYTQKLVNKSTNVNGTAARFIGMPNSDQNYEAQGKGVDRRHVEMSMGNLVKDTKKNSDGKEPYCRSWSVRNAYDKYDNLIRHDALWRQDQPGTFKEKGAADPARRLGSYSTLREPGIPKIAWEYDDEIEKQIIADKEGFPSLLFPEKYVIPYMFSIENLAWKDSPHYSKLPACEKGPHGGRIMWFPPYNIKFTDNTSVNWDTTSFIGRAEPIYTYNNTERTGTLGFTIVVDHPSILNKLKNGELSYDTTDEQGNVTKNTIKPNLETFFAGCSNEEIKDILRQVPEIVPEAEIPDPTPTTPDEFKPEDVPEINDSISFHFKNARGVNYKDGNTNNGYEQQPSVATNSSCPDGTVGRCFDYNYEKVPLEVYDNPKLYKGGSNASNTVYDCDETDITTVVPTNITTTGSELVVIPSGYSKLPCNGIGSSKPYGPFVNKEKAKRWFEGGDPNNNYCCTKIPNTVTIGPTTYKTNQTGYLVKRNGGNERWWGVSSYPFKTPNGAFGKPPKLELPIEVPGNFTASDGPSVPGSGISQLIEFLATTEMGKSYTISLYGNCSNFGDKSYNEKLSKDRGESVKAWLKNELIRAEKENGGPPKLQKEGFEAIDLFSEGDGTVESCGRYKIIPNGKEEAVSLGLSGDDTLASATKYTLTPAHYHPADPENENQLAFRRVDIYLSPNYECVKPAYDKLNELEKLRAQGIDETNKTIVEEQRNKEKARVEAERQKLLELAKNFVNECDYFQVIKKTDSFLYDSLASKLQNFHPAFHAITPEGLNSRLTFLQQCGRQGPSFIDPNQPQNTAFGRPPVAILRIGDFYFSRIIIDSINFDFDPLQWDLNPEGVGVQPMLVNVDINFKFIGGSTLQGPLRQLQNAVSYNFFANTAVYMPMEKILAKRLEKGFIVEGESGYDENTGLAETYFYGPWASQSIADDAINTAIAEKLAQQEINQVDSEITVEEADNDSQIEPGDPAPCEGARKLTKEEIDQKIKDSPNGGANFATALELYPFEEYDWYVCPNTDLKFVPKEESNPLNTEPGDTGNGTENNTTAQNTTTEDGSNPFAPPITSIPLNGDRYTIKNDFGQIDISGVIRGTSAGYGTFYEQGFSLLGLIPKFIYAAVDTRYTADWQVTLTEDSLNSGSNNAYIYDGGLSKTNEYSTGQVSAGNVPAQEAFQQMVAYNIIKSISYGAYENLSDWKKSYKNNDDFVMEEILYRINQNETFEFFIDYYIQLNSTKEGEKTKTVGGYININCSINKKGYEELVKILTSN